MNDIRKEYANTLKEIVKLESQIMKLRRKCVDLENRMEAMEKEEPQNLDSDGFVYWGSPD